jgi:hypothetical protein
MFIELTLQTGSLICLNKNNIVALQPVFENSERPATGIACTTGGPYTVNERYDEVKALVGDVVYLAQEGEALEETEEQSEAEDESQQDDSGAEAEAAPTPSRRRKQ